MLVTVNGDRREVTSGTTVGGLVETLGCVAKGTAVAVNQEVVPRSTWSVATLRDGDHVEVLIASQGG